MKRVTSGIGFSRAAFTLVELLVVVMVLLMVMAAGFQSLGGRWMLRTNELSTINAIHAAHLACQRLAREHGSAGAIYGYTLEFTSHNEISGQCSADGLRPWLIDAAGAVKFHAPPALNLEAEIGAGTLWQGDRIFFDDTLRPSASVTVAGVTTSTTAMHYLHVAFEPRTGFVHARMSTSSIPSFTLGGPGGISDAANLPTSVVVPLWNLLTAADAFAPTSVHHTQYALIISATGAVDVRDQ